MTDLALGFKITTKGGETTVAAVKDVRAQVEKIKKTNADAAATAAQLQKQYNLTEKEVEQVTQELIKSAKAAEQLAAKAKESAKQFKDLSNETQTFIAAISGGLAAGIGGLFANGIQGFAQFEQYEAVLTNTLGSAQEAEKALSQIEKFASATPFQLDEVVEGFIKLQNRGIKPTNEVLTNLGDLASSQGKELDQVVEAVLDAQTGEFERLKEFGITAKTEGDKVTLAFKGVEQEVAKTPEALAEAVIALGAMEGVTGQMAAQSEILVGRLSNLSDEAGKTSRVFGEQLAGGTRLVVDSAIALLQTFNGLPAPLQTVLVTTTGMVGVLGLAVAAIAAYNLASGQKIVAELQSSAATLQSAAATQAKAAQLAVATVAQSVYAVATGKATQAQIAQVGALQAGAVTLAAFAGAVAAVALVADTFAKTTAEAGKTRDSIAEVQGKLDQINAVSSGNPIEALAGSQAQQNLQALQNDLGGVQGALDRVRGVIPGLATAQEASVNRQTVAFGDLVNKIGEVEQAAIDLAVDLSNGASVPAEDIQKTVEAIDSSIAALEAQRPVTEDAIALRDAQIERLETYRGKITESTDATANLTDVTGGLSDAIKSLNADLQDTQAELEATATEAIATARELEAAGEISGEEADRRVAAAEGDSLRQRVENTRAAIAELQELEAAAQDPEAQAEINREIVRRTTELNRDRVSLAQDQVKAQEDAAKASEAAAKAAEAERTKAAEAAAKERERIAKAEADAIAAARDQESQKAQDTFDAGAEQRAEQLEERLQTRREEGQAAITALREQAEAKLQDEQKTFAKSQQAEAAAFQKQQQNAAQAFQRSLDAERNRGNQELDAVAREADRATQLRLAGDDAARAELQTQFDAEDRKAQIRREEEAKALANRDQIVGDAEQNGELGLSPLEQARADFEAGLQAKAAAFQEQQQIAAQAFQEAQTVAAEEKEAQLNEQRKINAAEIAQAEKDLQAEIETLRKTERDAERERERAFAAEQRQLDEQSANRVQQILAAASSEPTPRFKGGPIEPGQPYTVAERGPELVKTSTGREILYDRPTLINPTQRGWVYTAGQTRQRLAARAAQMGNGRTAPVMAAGPSIDVAGLRQDVQALQGSLSRPNGGDVYNLQGVSKGMTPAEMALKISAGKLRQQIGG